MLLTAEERRTGRQLSTDSVEKLPKSKVHPVRKPMP
jgi:hypothetical protein